MKKCLYLFLLLCLCSCAAQQGISKAHTYRSARVDKAPVTATMGAQSLRLTVSMQTVVDSLVIMSVQILPGVEVYRLEATPQQCKVIDKVNRRFAVSDYKALRALTTPALTYNQLQRIACGVPQKKSKKHVTDYQFLCLGTPLTLHIDYPVIRYNEPMTLTPARTLMYKQVDWKDLAR